MRPPHSLRELTGNGGALIGGSRETLGASTLLVFGPRCSTPRGGITAGRVWRSVVRDRTDLHSNHHGTTVSAPLRLAIVDDYAVVIAGVASFLAAERIEVVETGASKPVISDVDIVLYDTFAQVDGDGIDLEDFVRDSGAKVVIYSWNLQPQSDRASDRRWRPRLSLEGAHGTRDRRGTRAGHARRDRHPPRRQRDECRRCRRLARALGRADPPRGRDPGADHPGPQQPGDCRPCLSQHQLGEDLHP